uniref:Uncharacterized protein n=1 Tax=Trichogramma kaykai TaxID=54128 RepID=A0ABD2WWA9_9HYME
MLGRNCNNHYRTRPKKREAKIVTGARAPGDNSLTNHKRHLNNATKNKHARVQDCLYNWEDVSAARNRSCFHLNLRGDDKQRDNSKVPAADSKWNSKISYATHGGVTNVTSTRIITGSSYEIFGKIKQ